MPTYQSKMNELVQEPFKELMARFPEVKKEIEERGNTYNPDKDGVVGLTVVQDGSWGNAKALSARFSLSLVSPTKGSCGQYFAFTLDYYPVCCAVKQLNNFTYNFTAPQEFMNELIDLCIRAYESACGLDLRRVVMNFVGYPKKRHAMSVDIPVEDSKAIIYPQFYAWAKSKPHMSEMVFRNHNTDNNIHMAQILIKE